MKRKMLTVLLIGIIGCCFWKFAATSTEESYDKETADKYGLTIEVGDDGYIRALCDDNFYKFFMSDEFEYIDFYKQLYKKRDNLPPLTVDERKVRPRQVRFWSDGTIDTDPDDLYYKMDDEVLEYVEVSLARRDPDFGFGWGAIVYMGDDGKYHLAETVEYKKNGQPISLTEMSKAASEYGKKYVYTKDKTVAVNDDYDRFFKKSELEPNEWTYEEVSRLNNVPVTGVEFKKDSITISEGDFATFKPTISPENATEKILKWEITDEDGTAVKSDAAEISSEGVAYFKKSGEYKITATAVYGTSDKTVSDSYEVVVRPAITLKEKKLKMKINQKKTIHASVRCFDKNIKWKTTNSKVADVTPGGVVVAVGKGTCNIKATVNVGGMSKTAVCKVGVYKKGQTLKKKLSLKSKLKLKKKESVTYKSSDKTIATVNKKSGKVTGRKRGSCEITATIRKGKRTRKVSYTVFVTKSGKVITINELKVSAVNECNHRWKLEKNGTYSVKGEALYHVGIEEHNGWGCDSCKKCYCSKCVKFDTARKAAGEVASAGHFEETDIESYKGCSSASGGQIKISHLTIEKVSGSGTTEYNKTMFKCKLCGEIKK